MSGIYIFGLLCLACYVDSKPNGAPQDSCFYMTPRHIHPHTNRKVFPTRAMGLYNITTSADVFRPDRPIRVTLWGPPFKGFMMVAAEEGAKDWPTGIFYSDDGSAKMLKCLANADTATHTNNSYKDSVSVLWYGPENIMSEQIQFIATVVVNLTIYYPNIRSGFLRFDPTLSGTTVDPEGGAAGGGEVAPVAVTMDPWLSDNSVTQAPTTWWNANSASRVGGWGSNTGRWGSNTGERGSSAAGGWGSNTGSDTLWGLGNGGQSPWGTGSGSASYGNAWNFGANDWQEYGKGSVSSKNTNLRGARDNAQTGTSNEGSKWSDSNNVQSISGFSGNIPGTGRAVWNWDSGSVTTRPTPSVKESAGVASGGAAPDGTSQLSGNNLIKALLTLLRALGAGATKPNGLHNPQG